VLDGAGHDAVDAPAEHPRIVAHPAVQGVGDDRVAAELEVFDAARLIEPDLADDASGLVDGEDGVELLLGRDRVELLAQGRLDLLSRIARDLVDRPARFGQVRADVFVERGDDERNGPLAGVVAQVRRDDLAVARERFAHGADAGTVVHARGQKEHEQHCPEGNGHHHVPETREEHPSPFPRLRTRRRVWSSRPRARAGRRR
jgi:hypothetical protein